MPRVGEDASDNVFRVPKLTSIRVSCSSRASEIESTSLLMRGSTAGAGGVCAAAGYANSRRPRVTSRWRRERFIVWFRYDAVNVIPTRRARDASVSHHSLRERAGTRGAVAGGGHKIDKDFLTRRFRWTVATGAARRS